MVENAETVVLTYHNDDCATLDQITLETFLDDPGTGMHVESREDIIKQNNCGSGVDRPCECHACLLNRLCTVRPTREGRKNKPSDRHSVSTLSRPLPFRLPLQIAQDPSPVHIDGGLRSVSDELEGGVLRNAPFSYRSSS